MDNKIYTTTLFFPNLVKFELFNLESKIDIINLESFNLDSKLVSIFELPPISYVVGGLFGDFIHCLSIINENFYKFGRKGIIYISENFDGDKFNLYI